MLCVTIKIARFGIRRRDHPHSGAVRLRIKFVNLPHFDDQRGRCRCGAHACEYYGSIPCELYAQHRPRSQHSLAVTLL